MASSVPSVVLVAPAKSIHTQRWATFLAGAGHRVTVVTPTPMPAAVPGVSERLVPGRQLPPAVRNAVGAVWIRGVLRQARPDAVHVHSLGANAVLAVGVPARLLVVTPWGSDIAALRGRPVRRLLVAHCMRRARRVVTTSHDMAVQATALGARPERVSTISWGVDDAVFRPPVTPAEKSSARARWRLPANRTVVVCARSASPTYRTREVVSAFQAAARRRHDLHLVVLGSFRPANRSARAVQRRYWNDVVALAERTPETITLIQRLLGVREMATLFRAADVAVSVPRADQRSSTVLEAVASGLAVLLSDIPAYRELREDGAAVSLLPEPIEATLARHLDDLPAPGQADPDRNSGFIAGGERWATQAGKVAALYLADPVGSPPGRAFGGRPCGS